MFHAVACCSGFSFVKGVCVSVALESKRPKEKRDAYDTYYPNIGLCRSMSAYI